MSKLRITFVLLISLIAGGRAASQPIYYNTSSATQSLNSLDRVATNGTANTNLLTAVGSVGRCTAAAVDGLSGKLFFIDGASNALWTCSLTGSNLTLVKSGLTNFPTDLALDVLNQKIYFTTSSTISNKNTIQRIDYTGSNGVTLFTSPGTTNSISRCTSLAVDLLNSKIFVADAGAQAIWSLNLAGGGLALLATVTNGYPTGVAADPTNQLVYFTASSPLQNSNRVLRVSYGATGLTTLFTASGSVRRCTALDLDVARATIYLSDAGSNSPALWKLPLAGGSATAVLSGLPATAKKVRWFGGPTSRPAPRVTGIQLASGTNVILNATNGYIGGTYYVLTSTNVSTPLAQWQPLSTNVLAASGNFSLITSNSFSKTTPKRFYLLQVQ
jgi:hypothetical protein